MGRSHPNGAAAARLLVVVAMAAQLAPAVAFCNETFKEIAKSEPPTPADGPHATPPCSPPVLAVAPSVKPPQGSHLAPLGQHRAACAHAPLGAQSV